MTSIICKYFIQNEDYESESDCSNLFILSKKYAPGEKVKFKEVKSQFPLMNDSEVNYHLRFQTTLPGHPNSPIWVDILNEEAHVPLAEPGLINIKALRLPLGFSQKMKQPKPAPDSVDSFSYQAPSENQSTKDYDKNDEEFDVSDKSSSEENKARPRLDSETRRAVFDIDFGGSQNSPQPDLAPPLQPKAYQPTPQPAPQPAPAQTTYNPIYTQQTTYQPRSQVPNYGQQAKPTDEPPKAKPEVTKLRPLNERVKAAVI